LVLPRPSLVFGLPGIAPGRRSMAVDPGEIRIFPVNRPQKSIISSNRP
jgi:hypothetical protein